MVRPRYDPTWLDTCGVSQQFPRGRQERAPACTFILNSKMLQTGGNLFASPSDFDRRACYPKGSAHYAFENSVMCLSVSASTARPANIGCKQQQLFVRVVVHFVFAFVVANRITV